VSRAVVATAASGRSALGTLRESAAALARGETALAPADGDAAPLARAPIARLWADGEAPEDDPALRILGAHGRLLEALAREAHAAAGLAALPRDRVGLFLGLPAVDPSPQEFAAALRGPRAADGGPDLGAFFAGAWRAVHPLWPLSSLANVAAGQVSIDLDLRGDNAVLAADADAGLRALLDGARSIADGFADAVLAGGASARLGTGRLARERLRSRAPRALGEGGAVLALEAGADASARGVAPLARLLGGGSATRGARDADGAEALAAAVEAALADAGITAARVARVFAHRDGDRDDDAAEARALARLLPAAARLATKEALGHLGPGSGAFDAALACAEGRGVALVVARGAGGGVTALCLERA
jgi:3-oxoacyl-(acyl-carrier-protein) synthase